MPPEMSTSKLNDGGNPMMDKHSMGSRNIPIIVVELFMLENGLRDCHAVKLSFVPSVLVA